MTGEPTHTASEMAPRAPAIVKYPLRFVVSLLYSIRIKNCSKSIPKEIVPRTPIILIIVWKVKYLLRFAVGYVQPVTQQYGLKSTSAIKIATMKIRTIPFSKGSHHVLAPKRHLSLSAKRMGHQRRTLVSPWRMYCTYCGMPKSTCRAEATSDSEKNQARSLSRRRVTLVWRHQSVTYSVSRKFRRIKFF